MKPKSSIEPEREVVTSVRLSVDEHMKLRVIAAREHRSLSNQIRYMIERYELPQDEAA